ncbi:1-phosphofructokinase [Chloroflexus islandicus]|uniref:1-phosphofructokinase n=1 Tax=Chloroflexus islandicus TaxID=1707952 RepID=A0A178M9H9_9CHLR|nr:hexose kinase [Chloroflexus islandicus]OAN45193.1 1-phosphofructokinase [Chloroflexus islandicus]
MPQPTLCVITPNPALDRILIAPELRLGAVRRVAETRVAAGGKGLNVARAAKAIGTPAVVCTPLGGLTGQQVAWLAAQEGVYIHTVAIAGETRVCTLIVDPATGEVTVLNEVGPHLSDREWSAFTGRVLDIAAEWYLICGSLPPGPPPSALAELIATLHQQGRRVMVDTSGAALKAAVEVKPAVVKVNGEELGALLEMSITSVADAQHAVLKLHQRGIEVVVVTLGAYGAVGIDDHDRVIATPPQIPVRNPIGCGDTFFAGLANAFSNGHNLAAALRIATACAAADAQTLAPGAVDRATAQALLDHVAISYW